ncbi:phosphatidylserine decarboxylase-domain-containing protein [Russula ochroleuca]|jgi:phosphatidylserine decarboxylase|uniref:Phosphatidylserine decarboxylase proenzyme 2 n=1 Tax=Russula ochroleuca TaxID=152965 RepID=A0A9P5N5A1_9AGAM|nr:phosphatidylserine decarboxylase-domain-containing protein [Russula ochroleuca]
MVASKKGLKIGRALRSAARLPIRVSAGRGSGRNAFLPNPGEAPIVILRVRVLSCQDLVAKDRNGLSDPFVNVSILSTRFQTPVCRRTLSPVFTAKDATFDFPIYLSLSERLGVLEFVVWDKDMLRKEYLGEYALPLDEWFRGNVFAYDDPDNQPFSVNLISSRATTNATGTMHIKVGFVHLPDSPIRPDFAETYNALIKRSRPSLVSAPPTQGIGTIRSHQHGPEYEDDGLSSDDADGQDGEASDDEDETEPKSSTPDDLNVFTPQSQSSSPDLTPTPSPTAASLSPAQQARYFLPSIPKILTRRPVRRTSAPPDTSPSPQAQPTSTSRLSSVTTPTARRKKIPGPWNGQKSGAFELEADNDIVGIVMLEIHSATDLPRLRNMTRTGWDMDPFVVVSFGKKVFRTRVIRHSLNPVWDEKLLFHVRKYERSFRVQLTVLDWDKLSSNDHVGDAAIEIAELAENVPKKDPDTGLYPEDEDGTRTFQEFKLPLATVKEMPRESKQAPIITFRAKYQPYDALRQRLWSELLNHYDADDTRTLSHIELTSMLDSLGSTLSTETIDSFFTRWDKNPRMDELTFPEAIQCLETEICRPNSEKKRIEQSVSDEGGGGREREPGTESGTDISVSHTPNLNAPGTYTPPLKLDSLTFSGPPLHIGDVSPSLSRHPPPPRGGDAPAPPPAAVRQGSTSSSAASDTDGNGSGSGDEAFERVINIKNCPLCQRPRLNSKAEKDIVTHLAVCASQDWARMDHVMVSNFVTAVQAQRKWYTNVLSKVSAGNYKIGANSANIIVQNRMTGQLEEEKMQVYVRLGIRLLYKGARSRLEGARARRLLKSLSIKQGIKYDSPESAYGIQAFIEFHKLNVDEILNPLSSFKTFNQFFYRKLKPDARPVETPEDPNRLVSGADCRLMAFETTSDATKLWIKGREFTVARLLGDAYKDQAELYVGGSLVIFRLAPQDYHRFHSPVDGTIGPMTYISGEYYTVNPQAVRTTLDVYGENARKVVPIDSPQFGRVMAVCIGAMMVGSIKTTVSEGDFVKRGQEFGYFAFGGSTIVCLFEKNVVEWDEDLLINGRASLETLVRVGMGIGRRRGSPAPLVNTATYDSSS